ARVVAAKLEAIGDRSGPLLPRESEVGRIDLVTRFGGAHDQVGEQTDDQHLECGEQQQHRVEGGTEVLGRHVEHRLVTSAKSWLCHAGVDRSAPLLPWTAPPDVARISPVEASARYLQHMVESWNYEMARERPENRLEKQSVILTV